MAPAHVQSPLQFVPATTTIATSLPSTPTLHSLSYSTTSQSSSPLASFLLTLQLLLYSALRSGLFSFLSTVDLAISFPHKSRCPACVAQDSMLAGFHHGAKLREELGYGNTTKQAREKMGTAWGTQQVPQFVYDYAPMVHLYDLENYWPCPLDEHLRHTTPFLNYTMIRSPGGGGEGGRADSPTLINLDDFNQFGRFVFLKSDDDPEGYPAWLGGERYKPDQRDDIPGEPRRKGRSEAPGVLIVVEKPDNVTDAFWFYFYSFNLGNSVFNIRFGNHVGDWEHSMVRFVNGKPTHVYLSVHSSGDAYPYDRMLKYMPDAGSSSPNVTAAIRPLVFSASGTHANYAMPGKQEYSLPLGLLADYTSAGPVWDLSLNSYTYFYNSTLDLLYPASATPDAPTEWFYFNGRWGDKAYPVSDSRQYQIMGQWHYVSGPSGPRLKNLGRKDVCEHHEGNDCIIHNQLRKGRGGNDRGLGRDWRGGIGGEDPELGEPGFGDEGSGLGPQLGDNLER